VVVLCIGTNNHGNTADQVFEGIMEIVRVIRSKQDLAQIVVVVSDMWISVHYRYYL